MLTLMLLFDGLISFVGTLDYLILCICIIPASVIQSHVVSSRVKKQ
jgi:hypothetical protein